MNIDSQSTADDVCQALRTCVSTAVATEAVIKMIDFMAQEYQKGNGMFGPQLQRIKKAARDVSVSRRRRDF